MAQVTIVPDDNTVLIDGEAREVSMAGIDPDIHAVQWDGTKGEIEFRRLTKRRPEKIDNISPFQVFIDRWAAAAPPPAPAPTPPPPKSSLPLTAEELATLVVAKTAVTDQDIADLTAAR